MLLVPRSLWLALLALLPLLSLVGSSQTADKYESLLRNPPFGGSAAVSAAVNAAGHSLEFRSRVVQGDRSFFSIYDHATRRATWLELNAPVDGLLIKEYDAPRGSISVTHQGRPLTLTLKRSVVLAQAVPAVAPVVASASPPSVRPTAEASSARQRQLVIEELRRRAQREQTVAKTR